MIVYTAHLRLAREPILVQEGWTWAGFLFGPLWLLAQRAWIPAIIDLALFVCLFALLPPGLHGPGALGLALIAGLMGRDLVRWSLARRGYTLAQIVAAPDPDAALVRLLTAQPTLLQGLP